MRSSLVAALVLAAGSLSTGCQRETARPDVLLITLDTTRTDMLGAYGGHGVTPNLDALAAGSARYTQAITTAPYTGPSHASILTGLVPPRHGLRDYLEQALPEAAVTLPELLSEAGYTTAAFVSTYVLDPRFGLDQGFGVYSSPAPHPRSSRERRVERPATETADLAVAWVREQPRKTPVFVWVHFYDAHRPFATPRAYRAPLPPGVEEGSPRADRQRYYEQARLLDDGSGRVIEALQERRREPPPVFAVVADHGELMGEHGRKVGAHSFSLNEGTLLVPLLLHVPGRTRAGVVPDQVSVVDLAPTLLDAAGLPAPEGLDGRSLLGGAGGAPRPAYAETLYEHYPARAKPGRELASVRYDGWKLVARPGRRELYDLASDPGELRDVSAAHPRRLEQLEALLERLHEGTSHGERALDLSEHEAREHRERLRSLGYLE